MHSPVRLVAVGEPLVAAIDTPVEREKPQHKEKNMRAKMRFGEIEIEAEGDTKSVFGELASAAEVFGNSICGQCGSGNVVPVVREVDGNTYYEMRCTSCGCTLGFGQRKVGGALFPRRKKDENWLPNRGWVNHRKESPAGASEPF